MIRDIFTYVSGDCLADCPFRSMLRERPAGFRFPVVLTGRRKQPEGLQGHVVFVPDNDPVFPDSFRFRAGQRDGTVVLPAALR